MYSILDTISTSTLICPLKQRYMTEMIHERQAAEKIERHDLFSQLLEANDNNLDVTALTESELIGDYFSSKNTSTLLVIET